MIKVKGVELDSFTEAYLTCALFATNDESDEFGGVPLDDNYSIEDFSVEALEEAKKDCEDFQQKNWDLISQIDGCQCSRDSHGRSEYSGLERAGHDYFFTRCGHGVGFWDRNDLSEEVRDGLTEASKKAGEVWVYVGDDGQLHIS